MPSADACPSCGSSLVQPMRWEQRDDGTVLIELRCPECLVVAAVSRTAAEMAELDRRQAAERDALVDAYEAAVAENMALLADNLGEALRRDLVGADDFRPRVGRRRIRDGRHDDGDGRRDDEDGRRDERAA